MDVLSAWLLAEDDQWWLLEVARSLTRTPARTHARTHARTRFCSLSPSRLSSQEDWPMPDKNKFRLTAQALKTGLLSPSRETPKHVTAYHRLWAATRVLFEALQESEVRRVAALRVLSVVIQHSSEETHAEGRRAPSFIFFGHTRVPLNDLARLRRPCARTRDCRRRPEFDCASESWLTGSPR